MIFFKLWISLLTLLCSLSLLLQLNPTVDLFGDRQYAHPLLAPDSSLMASSLPLTDVAIDPELLIEVIEEEESTEKRRKQEDEADEESQKTEIDVVQGLVDDLALIVKNRASLFPLLEELTATRDRLCTMLNNQHQRAGD